MADDLEALTGGLRRMWSTASLTSKLGVKAARRVLFRRGGGDGGDDAALDPDQALASTQAAIAAAEQLVAKMGQLKGLVMKAGQIASYMPGSLPPAAQQVMAKLQAQSQPMAFPQIAAVIRDELGDGAASPGSGARSNPESATGCEGIFETIEERPFAAASIGQVHRATWRGRPVAVKVQYPGIEDAIRSDLKMVAVIARLSTVGSAVDGGALAGELRDRLIEECDYHREAANQQLFARLLAGYPGAHVPAVVAERSSRRVLTTELVDALRLGEVADQAARDRAGQSIFRTSFELLWQRCIYNADPHPGNYLISAAGEVTFLDFGCVRRFDREVITTWRRLGRAILDNDLAGCRDGFVALGFVPKPKRFDWDYQLGAMRELYRPFLEPGFRFDAAYVAKSFSTLMFDNPNRFRLAMPPHWLFLNRLQWGLNAVLAQLSATGPWRDIIEGVLASPVEPV